MSNPKDRLTIVNQALIGPENRAVENPLNFHPMMRRSWNDMSDTIRAVLGTYYTAFDNGLGDSALINYSDLNQMFFPDPVGLIRAIFEAQVRNTVLTLDIDPMDPVSPTITLTYDAPAWNQYQGIDPQAVSYLAPLPTYVRYFLGGNDLPYADPPVDNVPGILPMAQGVELRIRDHTSVFLLPSVDDENVSIRSEYNYYADGIPPYEESITNPLVREYILPNGYMYQAELRNTTSVLLTNNHLRSLTLDGAVDWFVIPASAPAEGVLTEDASRDYYQLYSQGISSLLALGPSAPGGVNAKAEALRANKNLVILNSDIALADAGYYNPTAPFGVKITINQDPNTTFVGNVLSQLDDDFVDLLQMRAVERMLLNPAGQPYAVGRVEYTDPADPLAVALETSVERDYDLYNVEQTLSTWNGFAGPIGDLSPSRYDEVREDNGTDEYVLLRDWSRTDLPSTTYTSQDQSAAGSPESYATVSLEGAIDFVDISADTLRTYADILNNTPCHTETLMYVIEKRRYDRDSDTAQRIFISARFEEAYKPLVYYDTQVKYGQRYEYNIRKIAMVFGNEYAYIGAEFADSFVPTTVPDLPPASPDLPPASPGLPPGTAGLPPASEPDTASESSPPFSPRDPSNFTYENIDIFGNLVVGDDSSGPAELQDDDETPPRPTQPGGPGGLLLDTSLKPHTANPQGASTLNLPGTGSAPSNPGSGNK